MRNLFLIVMLPCLFLTAGCSSVSQAKEMVAGVYAKYQVLEGKLADTQAEVSSVKATAEEAHGAMDTDGDGSLTMGERSAFVAKVAAGAAAGNQQDKDMLLDWRFWLALTGAGASGTVVRKAKKTLINPAPASD